MGWVFVVIISLLVGLLLALVGFVLLRRWQLQRHGYERSLRLVVLKLELPPVSEDVNTANRDFRDIVDENIAQAQVLYNVLAATADKSNFKTSYYGQRHFGFEVVAQAGLVNFYVITPKELIPIIKQAILSAYTSAKVAEVADHNIFSEHGQLDSVAAGQLRLRAASSYPITTYLESKQDVMKSILNSVADLAANEGVAFQILLRPAGDGWAKAARSLAEAKKKGEDGKQRGEFVKDLMKATVKATEEESKPAPAVSGQDQALAEAIETKVQQPGFETSLRLVVSTADSARSQAIYRNLLASFSIFDNPGCNGFIDQKPRHLAKFVADFNLRLFPVGDRDLVLNTVELASLFHLPDAANIPTTQLIRQPSKQVDGPRNLPSDGLILGHNVFRGQQRQVSLRLKDRMRHMYVVGRTGTGKSVFLENLTLQDVRAGHGFCFGRSPR